MANLLGLGSSLYSIQIFNRYVGYGLDGTLVTLTVGAVMAIILEYVFRHIRARLVTHLFTPQDAKAHQGLFAHLMNSRNDAIVSKPPNYIFTTLKQLQQLQTIYSSQNLLVLLDLPFALLFILCVFLLLPALGIVVVLMGAVAVFMAWLQYRQNMVLQQQMVAVNNELDASLSNGAQHSAIAGFNAQKLLLERHRQPLVNWLGTRKSQTESQQGQQHSSQLVSGITSVAVIGIGAVAVTGGNMDIGSLIGANILAMRAINVINQAGRVWQGLSQGEALDNELNQALQIQEERRDGASPARYAGALCLKGISHSYDERQAPFLNNFSMNLEAGDIIAICGVNGRGKTSLAKIIVGLLTPRQGQVLVDGIDLRQLSINWWRQQIAYVPQEPTFLNISLRDNLCLMGQYEEQQLRNIIEQCGLDTMVDQHPDGLEQIIRAGGQHLPPGVRKRLALARALMANGQLLILDEAQDGMDAVGRKVLSSILQNESRLGKTIILFSTDKSIVTDAAHVFDLDTGSFTAKKGANRASH